MRQRVIPLLAPRMKHPQNGDGCYDTKARGLAVLNSPVLNKGTAFTAEERRALGLTGLLPPDISTLETQVKRAYLQYQRLPDALSRNVYLTALHDRNEVLFYRLLSEPDQWYCLYTWCQLGTCPTPRFYKETNGPSKRAGHRAQPVVGR